MAVRMSKGLLIAAGVVALVATGAFAVANSGDRSATDDFTSPVHRMMFTGLDTNRDGRIDRKEAESSDFSLSVKKTETSAEAEAIRGMSKGDRFMQIFDVNKDGVVPAAEFATVLAGAKPKAKECATPDCGK